jgi:DNA-binding response OmpR family regulator/DNA-binding CsgD family transcriptional regulator
MSLPNTNSGIILVVDDSPETLGLLNEALENAGYAVLIALEGKQALTIAEHITPDMVLLDAMMPKMDGFETCRRLKANKNLEKIPVIFMTGLSDTDSVVKGLEAGGVDYLTKPIKPNELLARMRVHLNNARLTNSARKALDATGQQLFTIDTRGHIIWATPLTQELFHQAGISAQWLETELAQQLRHWLQHQPNINQTYKLIDAPQALEVKLIDNSKHDEIVLKLTNLDGPTAPQQLQDQLNITKRESHVLLWIANGKTNKEVAEILSMSPKTVDKHLEQIYRKLGVDNRTSAATIAIKVLAE